VGLVELDARGVSLKQRSGPRTAPRRAGPKWPERSRTGKMCARGQVTRRARLSDDAKDPATRQYVSTTRLEAFSDGVFAIAITLLVLDPRDRTIRHCV
jgi:hypothetical protein